MAVEVKIQRKKGPPPPETPLKQRLAADLARLLPADAFAFALPDEPAPSSCFVPRRARDEKRSMRMSGGLPAIIIIHRGRALGLELSHARGHLSDAQRTIFPRLVAAGMRIEVARSFGEALAALREMGLEITTGETLSRQVAELFRDARSQTGRGGA